MASTSYKARVIIKEHTGSDNVVTVGKHFQCMRLNFRYAGLNITNAKACAAGIEDTGAVKE